MEHQRRAPLALFVPTAFEAGTSMRLGDEPAHHVHVRRARAGDPVRMTDGAGHLADGTIESLGKREVTVRIDGVRSVPAPVPLEVVVPVADRDRMLWAAEKAAELQVTAWRPTFFARSRSVSPRGDGEKFHEKVLARMQAALEQSGGAWLPRIEREREGDDQRRELRAMQHRFILDASGPPLPAAHISGSVAVAIGPEGGFEPDELRAWREDGWTAASLGATILRFETAVIAAAAILRSLQGPQRSM